MCRPSQHEQNTHDHRAQPRQIVEPLKGPESTGLTYAITYYAEIAFEVSGIEPSRFPLCGSATKVVMLTTFDLDQCVNRALEAGASGFVLKDVRPEPLVDGLRSMHAGEVLQSSTVTQRLIESYLDRSRADGAADAGRARVFASLTAREQEVLGLVARGLSNAEIARRIYVSEMTVKTYVSRMLMKLGLWDWVQAVMFVRETGLAISWPREGGRT